jgi:hypothetical protein
LQVATAVVCVTLLEDVSDDLAASGFVVSEVALEFVFDVVRVEKVDELADFVTGDCDADVGVWIPPWHFRIVVVLHENGVAAKEGA